MADSLIALAVQSEGSTMRRRSRATCRSFFFGAARSLLADDYARMLTDGMLLVEDEPFNALMERCTVIKARAAMLCR